MKKQVLVLLVGIIIGTLMFGTIAYAAQSNIRVAFEGIKIFVSGALRETDKQPFIYNGTTYVPLRFISEALGEAVEWDEVTKSIYIGGRIAGRFLTDVLQPTDKSPDIDLNGNRIYTGLGKQLDSSWVTYDLDGKYSRLYLETFGSEGRTIQIFADDILIWDHRYTEGHLYPIEVGLKIEGVKKLQFKGKFYVLNPIIVPYKD
jgi:hypothetical protein